MKLKYLFPSVLMALSMAFVACGDDDDDKKATDNQEVPTEQTTLVVSQKLVSLEAQGGQVEITISSSAAWTIAAVGEEPTWLRINPMKGAKGDTKVTFAAAETITARTAEYKVTCGELSSIIKVEQAGTKTLSTCQQVIEGNDSVVFCVKGKVKNIANTLYGNWTLEDETGEILIYGTLDKEGKTKNFESLGIEEGDIVTVEGPKKTYNNTPELVNVTVLEIQKGQKPQPAGGHGLSVDDPFTVAEALAKCEEVGATASTEEFFAKGVITAIQEVSTQYGNATYTISDAGQSNALTVYRGYYLNGEQFTSEDQIKIGDEVIVGGHLVNYTKNDNVTPEFTTGSKIYSKK